ncbi:LysR family transcriptional regulator [Pectinatus brassicae]|uniref:DNA-binding transcriptional LysR family regulator n=1 Tax=Pectinatus brassicae TaxID=862415 RepID=A0A840USC2_9FIRM|nr:LysR family transcriptional regulator [Pectinatus brassicae]MBB5335425.1 DNA-binding transcriptional LysR family regulator [Pectinatus brassicae]
MSEMPTIQQLENFIYYGEVKNFTLAAKKANITQSAFSAQIKKLEEIVGVKLISRSKRGSDFTKAGEEFYRQINEWLEHLHSIVYDVQSMSKNIMTNLHVGVLRSFGDVLMNQHVAHFQKNNENIRIDVYDMEENNLLAALRNEQIDIASIYGIEPFLMEEYERICFCRDKFVYYAPLLLQEDKLISVHEIIQSDFVGYPNEYSVNQVFQKYFLEHGKLPHIVARLATPYAMIHYCKDNEAGALLPKRLLKALGINNGWRELAQELVLEECLIYKKNNPKYKSLQIYIEYILSVNNN